MAKPDLGDQAVNALTRPGVGAALLAALGVYVVLVLQSLLGTLTYVFTGYAQDVGQYLRLIVGGTLPTTLGAPLPFAIGVFLAIWQIAPIAPQLRMAHVVTRALLAAVIGTVIAAVLGIIVGAVIGVSQSSPAIGSAIHPGDVARHLTDVVQRVLACSVNLLVDAIVVVPLAALLLWGWLQSHPTKTAPRGALDEV